MQTEMGRIAGMLKAAPDETTPLQKELDRVGKLLGIVVIVIAVVMIATIILVEDVRGFSAFFDVLILGVALAVAAVPEGLPAVVTAVLSLGVQRMARTERHRAPSRAVETLGSANVIASDKTGTLTKNEMTVRAVVTASGRVTFERYRLRAGGRRAPGRGRADRWRAASSSWSARSTVADRANNAVLQERDGRWSVQGDPTEGALIVAARKAGLEAEALDARFARVGEVPFSSERKLMSTVHTDADRQERLLVFTKGAPDVLLARCSHELVGEEARPLTAQRRRRNSAKQRGAWPAKRCARSASPSARCRRMPTRRIDENVEQDLVFLGLIGMIDPPRDEARRRRRAREGRRHSPDHDHRRSPEDRRGHRRELGIAADGRAVTGAELEKMSEKMLDRTVREVSVYARVNPEHKLRIVKALQRGGMTVAMTGDGVNDAPALKTADIGVAMGITGTDVSKEAADMVLADDNFATIVAAVEEGRAIFANIRKFLRYLLSSNIGEVMTMFFGVVLADAIGLDAAESGGRRAAAAGDADPLDQPGDRRCARARPRRRSGGRGTDEPAAAAARRRCASRAACGRASSSSASSWRPERCSCSTPRCRAA